MPSAFDKRFKRSGMPLLKSNYGEPVIYHLRAGGSRSITAIIEREPPSFVEDSGEVVSLSFIIRIDNDCASGVLASEVDTGGDEVELIYKLGDTRTTRRTIEKLISQDSGVVVLGVR